VAVAALVVLGGAMSFVVSGMQTVVVRAWSSESTFLLGRRGAVLCRGFLRWCGQCLS
jgi:hypothetical protein